MAEAAANLAEALSGRYAIERELGAGGMATVYLAEDLRHHRKVAVKVLRAELAGSLGPERFLREIETVAQLTHAHILPLFDSGRAVVPPLREAERGTGGEAEAFLYYVMPYIEGESLRSRLARERELPIPEAVRLLRDVADALAAAHRRGVVHRDIKPDNILLSEQHAYVTDFGVAKAVTEATSRERLTTAGVALGTPTYMAPEQAVADPAMDHRADIYAFGVVAYEVLAGQPPFGGGTAQAVLAAHVADAPTVVTEMRDAVPAPLADLIMRCLAKKPADRPQRADELVAQLESMVTPSAGTTPTTAVPRAERSPAPRRRRTALAAAGAVLVLGVLGVLFALRQSRGGAAALDQNAVAVVPFRVSGISGADDLATLREGMIDLMYTQLTGDAGLRALDPRAVLAAWHTVAKGDEDLAPDQAVRLAQRLGAGRLLLGTVLGTGGTLRITASLLTVPDGNQVLEGTVSGALDSLPSLVEALAVQLLSRSEGELEGRVAALGGTPLAAVKQYLAGIREMRATRIMDAIPHFDSALAVDSGFALAAFWLTGAGIRAGNSATDAQARGAPVVWRLRHRLPARDRRFLEAFVGRNYPNPTPAATYLEDLEQAAAAPDVMPWLIGRLAIQLVNYGDYLAIPDWRRRAADLRDRAVAQMEREEPADSILHLSLRVETAELRGDTSALRRALTRYLAADTAGDRRDLTLWRAAHALGDSTLIARARGRLAELPFTAIWPMTYDVAYDGLPLDEFEMAVDGFARRAVTRAEQLQADALRERVAFLRGRIRDAVTIAKRLSDRGWFATGTALDLAGTALEEPGWEPAVRDIFGEPTVPADTDPDGSGWRECALALWQVQHGDTSRARRAVAALDARGYQAGFEPVCARTLEAMLEGMNPNRTSRPALERLDSLMQTAPAGTAGWANMVLARLLESRGDFTGALRAVRRQTRGGTVAQVVDLPARLRAEGRLAALVGDTAGAVRAYERYLSFRTDPDSGELADEVARVREELRQLVGERKRS